MKLYHVQMAAMRYFALIYEEIGGEYPELYRILSAVNGDYFEARFGICDNVL